MEVGVSEAARGLQATGHNHPIASEGSGGPGYRLQAPEGRGTELGLGRPRRKDTKMDDWDLNAWRPMNQEQLDVFVLSYLITLLTSEDPALVKATLEKNLRNWDCTVACAAGMK